MRVVRTNEPNIADPEVIDKQQQGPLPAIVWISSHLFHHQTNTWVSFLRVPLLGGFTWVSFSRIPLFAGFTWVSFVELVPLFLCLLKGTPTGRPKPRLGAPPRTDTTRCNSWPSPGLEKRGPRKEDPTGGRFFLLGKDREKVVMVRILHLLSLDPRKDPFRTFTMIPSPPTNYHGTAQRTEESRLQATGLRALSSVKGSVAMAPISAVP